jgi:hypothetical protein
MRAALAALFALQMFNFAVRTRPEYYDWVIAVVEKALVPRWRR